MSDIEYIEPTQEHVGQMVEVRPLADDCWQKAKLLGVVDDEYRFAAKRKHDNYGLCWKYARIPRPLTYAERQAKCGLKVGDRVRFMRKWGSRELGTCIEFLSESGGMYGEIGQCGVVESVGQNGMRVKFSSVRWWLPYFVLEKVEDRVATQNDCGATVYVDGAPQDEFRIIVLWQEADTVWHAVVRSGDKRFVYELSNLRVKE